MVATKWLFILSSCATVSVTYLFWRRRKSLKKTIAVKIIPGILLSLSEEKPPISIEPGRQLKSVSSIRGALDIIKSYKNSKEFLQSLHSQGPVVSFYWGPRYVVSINDFDLMWMLRESVYHMLSINPLAFGSILAGDPKLSTYVAFSCAFHDGFANDLDPLYTSKIQNEIFMKGEYDYEGECNHFDANDSLKYAGKWLGDQKFNRSNLREELSRPLVVMFSEEINLDGYKIPEYVPIIFCMNEMVNLKLNEQQLLENYYDLLRWLPAFFLQLEHYNSNPDLDPDTSIPVRIEGLYRNR